MHFLFYVFAYRCHIKMYILETSKKRSSELVPKPFLCWLTINKNYAPLSLVKAFDFLLISIVNAMRDKTKDDI